MPNGCVNAKPNTALVHAHLGIAIAIVVIEIALRIVISPIAVPVTADIFVSRAVMVIEADSNDCRVAGLDGDGLEGDEHVVAEPATSRIPLIHHVPAARGAPPALVDNPLDFREAGPTPPVPIPGPIAISQGIVLQEPCPDDGDPAVVNGIDGNAPRS